MNDIHLDMPVPDFLRHRGWEVHEGYQEAVERLQRVTDEEKSLRMWILSHRPYN